MGGGGATSGGTYVRVDGRAGDLPTEDAKPNSRYDLYENGKRGKAVGLILRGK